MVHRAESIGQRGPSAFLLALTCAILLITAFPNFNVWPLAWFGLVPLFFAIEGKTPRQAFAISYIAGILFFSGTMYWLIHVTLPGMIILILYLALYFGFFSVFFVFTRPHPRLAVATVPAAWITLEYIRSNLFSGFGWALLGYSQSSALPAIQIADIAGAYGVSFLIVMVNCGVYFALKSLKSASLKAFSPLMIAGLCLLAALAYGQYRLNNIFTGEPLKVSVIQGSIPQEQKWEEAFRERIISAYEGLTREAALEQPDLIIWPETAFPGILGTDSTMDARLAALAGEVKAHILVGAPRAQGGLLYNSAILFSGQGKVVALYDKLNLVPFGEYIPFKKFFAFVERLAPVPIGDFRKGSQYTVFRFDVNRRRSSGTKIIRKKKTVKFSCLICFEDIFPALARQFKKDGAQFLVNITNDAWFKRSSAPYQHAQASVFRAVENRSSVVRAANTGLSCFIDQRGGITGRVADGKRDLFVDGFKTADIMLADTDSFYRRYGDIFVYLAMLLAAASVLSIMFRRKAL
ncbi:apolipoprotein N-acyltransferase [Candidatus Omnitrophota bacterium]